MKLLFDENLSFRLVEALKELFPGSTHVTSVGLTKGTQDLQIWEHAKQNHFAIVTADNDFATLAITLGPPPKIILLENCDYPTNVAVALISTNAIRITRFEQDSRPLLILRKP